MLGPVERALLAVLLITLMIGMGATLQLAAFRAILRRPRGVIVGLLSQFGWMPLVAYGLCTALELPAELAIGLLLVACTPGGTTSNLFTFFSGADVALSISMTVTSTLVAVVAMPLLLVVYAGVYEGADFDVPLGSIATTLLLVLVPVAIGMMIRAKSERIAKRAEKIGSLSGVVVLVILVASALIKNTDLFLQIPLTGYLAAFTLGALGIVLGYAVARIVGLNIRERRAVALETGIQNTPLAFAIILSSLEGPVQDKALHLPLLYALFILLTASVVTMIFRRFPTAEQQDLQRAHSDVPASRSA